MEQKTLSKQFEQELENELFDKNIIKPWSFRKSNIIPVYLNSTIEDIKTYWNQDARFREGFNINKKENSLYLPNFFVKIDGVYEDKKKYSNLLEILKGDIEFKNTPNEITTNINKYYFIENNNFKKLKNNIFNKKNITYEMIIELCQTNFNFAKLNEYISQYIVNKLNDFIAEYNLYKESDFIEEIIYHLVNLSDEMYNVLSNWDFPYKVPKVTIINDNINNLSETFLMYISYLNYLGFDVIFFSSRGEKIPNKKYIKLLNNIMLDKFIECKTKEEYEKELNQTKLKKNILISSCIISLLSVIIISFSIYFYNKPIPVYKISNDLNIGDCISDKDIEITYINRDDYDKNMIKSKKDILDAYLINDIKTNDILSNNDIIFVDKNYIENNIKFKNNTFILSNKDEKLSFDLKIFNDKKEIYSSNIIQYNEEESIYLPDLIDDKENIKLNIVTNIYYDKNILTTIDLDKNISIQNNDFSEIDMSEINKTMSFLIRLISRISGICFLLSCFRLMLNFLTNNREDVAKSLFLCIVIGFCFFISNILVFLKLY